VALSGSIDLASRDAVHDVVVRALRCRPSSVALDLADVEFLDCAGICGLLRAQLVALGHDCRLAVVSPSPAVARILTMTATYEQLTGRLEDCDRLDLGR
jgi:anti-anti-sigma factor